ncbi:YaiI/YqxD family protein [Photobacterium sp. NCIMB 13483]|uniref:UPF0178 protein CZ809_01873 n=1 Tax=Photobacterium piscicola TaxID=1378299 RepID=A0A1T5HZU9_9GAMM|nr:MULTISPECIES: YaiI/YqxD family protein [Photobacterium]MEC6795483.1 YaiI/YqxD family protein [Photobacterium sp. S4TG1]PST93487.1 YaiI/YqxD family protein [Photobacterium sp. NCIMB 13483]SKC32357.1 hypothetical protein CZ809_01873 [Photobacterium piscicola]
MKIWVDADACPNVVKEILFRAADRAKISVTLVANQYIRTPPSPFLRSIQVEQGFDVADNYIVQECEVGDLVITADIPLADELITKGAHALNPRGEMYTKDTIKQRLQMRDFMETMRSSGIQTGGPSALTQADRQNFANKLDAFLAKNHKIQ